MVAPLTRAPAAAVHQVKYPKLGLKFGALPIFSKKQARFVTRKVMRYVIVTKFAI